MREGQTLGGKSRRARVPVPKIVPLRPRESDEITSLPEISLNVQINISNARPLNPFGSSWGKLGITRKRRRAANSRKEEEEGL